MTASPALIFAFGPLRLDGPLWDWEVAVSLRVVAELSITVRGDLFLSEPEFTVVELASALWAWKARSDDGHEADLRFESIEAEDALLELRATDGGWILRSPWERFAMSEPVPTAELDEAISGFVERLVREVRDELGIEARALVEGRGPAVPTGADGGRRKEC